MKKGSSLGRVFSPATHALLVLATAGRLLAASLSITLDAPSGAARVGGTCAPGQVAVLEASSDLQAWAPLFATRQSAWTFADEDRPWGARRFYRCRAQTPVSITPSPTWKNRIRLDDDPFWSQPPKSAEADPFSPSKFPLCWVKFTLFLDDPTTVYFQDSRHYPLHYAYAVTHLDPFLGMEPAAYDRATLCRRTQRAVLGSVLFNPAAREYAIQFAGTDPYPPEMVRFLFETVDRAILEKDGARRFYLPGEEQSDAAFENAAYFARHQMPLARPQRWLTDGTIYAPGWAIGRLVWVPGKEAQTALHEGRITPDDILFTDHVPGELPGVAGIVTLSPATPNSHVAIWARGCGAPFVYITTPELTNTLRRLEGRIVLLRVIETANHRDLPEPIKVLDLTEVEPDFLAAVMSLKRPPALRLPAKARWGAYAMSLENATPADARHVGGKAAHFGFLRRVIPDHAPNPAIAFTFDLWDDYLQQVLPNGRTLAEEIHQRLDKYAYPPDPVAFANDLAALRELIVHGTRFTAAQRAAILDALSVFDPHRKLRFRSSANVEDAEQFSGAGLYRSYSGCVLDDRDADDAGPCACDPEHRHEHGVFRALRKVFASFYNENAVRERLRHRVKESEAGMAVLVHYSFPDAFELANGVATATFSREGNTRRLRTTMVTQKGAVSITHAEGNARPEVVELDSSRAGDAAQTTLHLTQHSTLPPAGGDSVLAWEADYRTFQDLFFDLAEAYAAYFTNRETFTLDFEYKKTRTDGLVVKQMRAVPAPPAPPTAPALLNEPMTLQISQGPHASVFANHRLKSLWTVRTDDRWLDETGRATCCFTRVEWTHALRGRVEQQTGTFSEWENARHLAQNGDPVQLLDRWTVDTDQGPVTLTWNVTLPSADFLRQCPIVTPRDFRIRLTADYSTPRTSYDSWKDQVTHTTHDEVLLEPVPPEGRRLPPITSDSYTVGAKLRFRVDFYIKPENQPPGMTGYTPTVWRFRQTLITGLLPDAPLRLRSYWSQTVQTYHKPYRGDFLFEPALDPEVGTDQLEALRERNIKIIFLRPGRPWEQPQAKIIGRDGILRNAP